MNVTEKRNEDFTKLMCFQLDLHETLLIIKLLELWLNIL